MLTTYIGDDGLGVVKTDFRGMKSKVLVCELGHRLVQGQGICASKRSEKCHFSLPPGFIDLEAEVLNKKGFTGLFPCEWHMQAESRASHH